MAARDSILPMVEDSIGRAQWPEQVTQSSDSRCRRVSWAMSWVRVRKYLLRIKTSSPCSNKVLEPRSASLP